MKIKFVKSFLAVLMLVVVLRADYSEASHVTPLTDEEKRLIEENFGGSTSNLTDEERRLIERQTSGHFRLVAELPDTATSFYFNDELGNLSKVDVGDVSVDWIGNTGFPLTDIAFDPSANLYGLTFDKLWRVDQTTAAATLVGSHGIPGANSLVFGNDGTLYAGGANTRGLYTINPNTASSNLIGDMGFNMSGDLAFHNEKLYGASYNPSSDSFAIDHLLEINASTGAGTIIGPIGPTSVFGLASPDNGILYGVAGTSIFSINTTTGSGFGTRAFDYRDSGSGLGNAWGAASLISSPPLDDEEPPPVHPPGAVELQDAEPVVSVDDIPPLFKPQPEPPPQPSTHGLWSMQEQNGKMVFLPGITGFNATKPTVVLVHGWVPNNIDDNKNLIDSTLPSWIYDTVGNPETGTLGHRDNVNVLAWNWVDVASTSYGLSEDKLSLLSPQAKDPLTKKPWPSDQVWQEGVLMSRELKSTFLEATAISGKVYDQPIQLIGASNGSGVVVYGGYLLDAKGYSVDQITLFDAPEGGITPDFARLSLDGWLEKDTEKGIWIDNYPTSFGKNYPLNIEEGSGGGIVNVDTKGSPPTVKSILDLVLDPSDAEDHGYPFNWYFGVDDFFNSTQNGTLSKVNGLPNVDVGAAWSKVLNDPIQSDQEIDDIRKQLGIYNVYEAPDPDTHPYTLVPFGTGTVLEGSNNISKQELGFDLKKGDVYYLDGVYHIKTNSPVFLFDEFDLPIDSQFLTFDFLLENPLPEDQLWFFVGNDPLFGFTGDLFPDNWDGFLSSPPINISQYAGTNQWLTFLYDSDEKGHRAQIGNINLYRFEENTNSSVVPEPSTLALLGMGLFGGAFRFRFRRRESQTHP